MLEITRLAAAGTPVSLRTISAGTGIPQPQLNQVSLLLRAARLLRGHAGRAGGHTLARPAQDIRVRDIVEAADGSVDLVPCVRNPAACGRSQGCESRVIWGLLASRMRAVLDEFTLADLVDSRFLAAAAAQLGETFVPLRALRTLSLPHQVLESTACPACDEEPRIGSLSDRTPPGRAKGVARRPRKGLVSG